MQSLVKSSKPKIEFINIVKKYKKLVANDNISFAIKKNTIHGLIGENGSGKTTLMSVLAGLALKDSGEIKIDGKVAKIHSAKDAAALKIGILTQHFLLAEEFSVWQNVILGCEDTIIGFLNLKKIKKQINDLIKKYDFPLKVNDKVKNLSLSQKQLVEILKLLYQKSEVLIFDEPTSILSTDQIEQIYKIFRSLKKEGRTIIFITHKLKEILNIADECSILRGGKFIRTVSTKSLNYSEISNLLIGEKILEAVNTAKLDKNIKVRLRVNDLTILDKHRRVVVDKASFKVYSGSIFAIAGVSDNGQAELADCLTGFTHPKSGEVYYNNKLISSISVKQRQKLGMQFIPADRLETGLVLNYSIRDNMLIGNLASKKYVKHGFVRYANLQETAKNVATEFSVKGVVNSNYTPVKTLSGGNMQKVMVGRVLCDKPPFILAFQPTWGIDIKAIHNIHKHLLTARAQGAAILLISYEIDEILALADYIAVIYRGKLSHSVPRSEVNVQKIGALMSGHDIK